MTYTHGPSSTAGSAAALPTSRYVLPDFEERTPYGYRRQNPYTKLFEDRIIFLGVQVDDASADASLALLPAAVLLALDRYRNLGHQLTARYLVSRQGSLVRRTVALQKHGVIGWTIRQMPNICPCCGAAARRSMPRR